MPDKIRHENSTGPHRFSMDGWISRAPFERLLHMEIVEAAGGKSVLTMPFLLDLAQGAGLMHGGALVSLADTAVAMAIKSMVEEKSHFATISLETRFLAPVKKGTITARAEIVGREGRIWKGKAVVYDEDARPVMEFMSVFKMAKDLKIRGEVEFPGKG
jgi:uncharacterized protein (TIGR00369 family)